MVFNFDVRAIWRSVTILAILCIKGLIFKTRHKGTSTALSAFHFSYAEDLRKILRGILTGAAKGEVGLYVRKIRDF